MSDMLRADPHLYAIVAGELSGDTLGAGLIAAIKRSDPKARFVGIGGPKMCALGFESLFDINEISVMGLFEVLSHVVPILKIRRAVTKRLLELRPRVMVGIDAPDFNLAVEHRLKKAGIPTVHYVSPSVWAWREGRMKKIRAACDEVLALLPFEKDYYDRHDMPCTYVGHSLANSIPLESDQKAARERLAFDSSCVEHGTGKVLVILPGSRTGVIKRMLPVYAAAARIMKARSGDLTLISAAPDRERAMLIKDIWLSCAPELSLTVFVGDASDVISAGDVCLVTSGTAAFEVMLLKRPMAVAYRMSAVTAAIARRLVRTKYISLPNLLADRELVKEFIQGQCTAINLAGECLRLLGSDNLLLKKEFTDLHEKIRCDSDGIAARAVLRVARDGGSAEEPSDAVSETAGESAADPKKSDAKKGGAARVEEIREIVSDDAVGNRPSEQDAQDAQAARDAHAQRFSSFVRGSGSEDLVHDRDLAVSNMRTDVQETAKGGGVAVVERLMRQNDLASKRRGA